MNENINLVEILKDCPKGTELYSAIHGKVHFVEVMPADEYSIVVYAQGEEDMIYFTAEGLFDDNYYGEMMLFPSKEQRDWRKWGCPKPKFDPQTLQPFDRVLSFADNKGIWVCRYFSHFENNKYYFTNSFYNKYCIPYNEDTKHLVGTTDEAPEYYRYWED